jgi:outer membrane protein TolC
VVTPPFCQGRLLARPHLPWSSGCSGPSSGSPAPPRRRLRGLDFGNLGFGAENTYNLGLNFNWSVFNGGRNQALTRVARAGREVAEIGLGSAEAQNQLDVTQAYFDARLSDQLLQIAEATLAQAEETLRLTELGARVGQQAEFDVLRARVARDNQRPAVIQRRAARDLAYDRLRTLLDIPQGQPLDLTTPLDGGTPPVAAPDTVGGRAPVRQAEQQVAVQRAQLAIARSQRLPSVSLTSQYGQVAFARNLFPELDSFRDNWTVGAALQIPVFTAGASAARCFPPRPTSTRRGRSWSRCASWRSWTPAAPTRSWRRRGPPGRPARGRWSRPSGRTRSPRSASARGSPPSWS